MTRAIDEQRVWPVQEAKARFSEFLTAALTRGPQVVSRLGVEEAVLVPIEQWRQVERAARPSLKGFLLGDGPRTDSLVPPRRRMGHRRPPKLD